MEVLVGSGVGGPQDHSQGQCFPGFGALSSTTQDSARRHTHSKRTQSKISEGERPTGRRPEEIRCELPKVLEPQIVRGVNCCPPEKPVRDSAPKVSTGGWSQRHPLPSMDQSSRLPGGTPVSGISHSVCSTRLGPGSHAAQLWGWGEPS